MTPTQNSPVPLDLAAFGSRFMAVGSLVEPKHKPRVSQFPFLPSQLISWQGASDATTGEDILHDGGVTAGPVSHPGLRARDTDLFRRLAGADEFFLRRLLKNSSRKERLVRSSWEQIEAYLKSLEAREKDKACSFNLAVYRARGEDIPKRAEWHTGMPVNRAREDVRTVHRHLSRAFRFTQSVFDDNALLGKIIPEEAKGLFCNELCVAVLDLAPKGSGDEGYPQAANTLGPDGENMTIYGKPPSPGSETAKIFDAPWKPADVTYHEWGHSIVNRLFAILGGALQYSFHSGAVNESTADLFAISARQYVDNPRDRDKHVIPLSGQAGTQDFQIGHGFVKVGSLRDILTPGSARAADHPMGPDEQKGNLRQVDFHDHEVYSVLNEDQGGVHVLNSVPNRAAALAILEHGGDSLPVLQIRLGAIALAASNGIGDIDFYSLAKLEVVSAMLLYGMPSAAIMRKTWEEAGIFDASTPNAEGIVKVTLANANPDGGDAEEQTSEQSE